MTRHPDAKTTAPTESLALALLDAINADRAAGPNIVSLAELVGHIATFEAARYNGDVSEMHYSAAYMSDAASDVYHFTDEPLDDVSNDEHRLTVGDVL